jgi:hypothetical protein
MYSIKNDEPEHDKVNGRHDNIRSGPQAVTISGRKRMAIDLVNLDALIPREDFFEVKPNPEPPPAKQPESMRLMDLINGITSTAWRKPDFQRETSYWKPNTIAEFVRSFVEGDLIPSVILWRSPTTGNIFVIDGAHRLSALIAWVRDDYGDRATSRDFFENIVPQEQEQAAQKTRNLIKNLFKKNIGSYESLLSAAKYPENSDPAIVTLAKNADFQPFPVLWVSGLAAKAEESFYRINLKAVSIDPTELRIIKSRTKPSALAARAIIRGGVGHKYWATFPELTQAAIRETAKSIHDILFVPPMPKTPLTTFDLPIAGRSYSGGDSLGLVFDFVSLANELVEPKQKPGSRRSQKEKKEKETVDADGSQTVTYLNNVKRIAQRMSGKHPSSLGLHPGVYFYGITGRYQPTAFLATVGMIQHLEKNNDGFNWFTYHRARFEEFLLQYRYFTNQIVFQFGGRLKSYDALLSYYRFVLAGVTQDKGFEELAGELQASDQFRYLKEREPKKTTRQELSKAIQTVSFVREAIQKAIFCKICHARISTRSISYDHIKRREDGGMGDPDNVQMTHPYCNSGYKESGGKAIPALSPQMKSYDTKELTTAPLEISDNV